jgi:hypothetical protein
MRCVAANIDITVYENGTYDKTFQWETGDPAAAVDITGYTAVMSIRSKLTSDTAISEISTKSDAWTYDADSGVYFDDAAEGKYRVYINDEDTQGICENHKDITGVYDLFLYSTNGEAVLKQYGVCTIKAFATRIS